MNLTSAEPRPVSPVERRLNEINGELNALHEAIAFLEGRLANITAACPATPPPPSSEDFPCECELELELDRAKKGIYHAGKRIDTLLETLRI